MRLEMRTFGVNFVTAQKVTSVGPFLRVRLVLILTPGGRIFVRVVIVFVGLAQIVAPSGAFDLDEKTKHYNLCKLKETSLDFLYVGVLHRSSGRASLLLLLGHGRRAQRQDHASGPSQHVRHSGYPISGVGGV